MKIVYQNVIWLLLFVAYNYLCLAEDNDEFVIGALFNEENSQAKIPLESAVYTNNIMEPSPRFKIETRIIPKLDSFKSSKVLCNMTQQNNGLIGVFGPPSFMVTPIIQSVCTNLEIPHVQINWRPHANYLDTDTVLNFYPDPDLLSQGLAAIVRHLQWRSFVVLYENDDGLIRLQDVLKLQDYSEKNKYNSIVVKQLGSGPDYRPLLKDVRNSTESKFIIDCDTSHILEIMQQAGEVGLLDNYFHYFLTSLDAHTLNFDVLNTTANVTTVRIINPENQDFLSALRNWQQYAEYYIKPAVDLDPYSIKTETALIHDAVTMFIESVKQIHRKDPIKTQPLTCNNENEKWNIGLQIASFMRVKSNPFGITGPIQFDSVRQGKRSNFTLYVVEGAGKNVIASWTPDRPESLNYLRSSGASHEALLNALQKGIFIISSREGAPYLFKKSESGLNGNDRYEGFSVDLISEIANIVGFKFEFKLAEDGKYGSYDPNTKAWNGLIKDILEHKARFAICDLTITQQRGSVVDFSLPFMRLGVSILYKKAEEKEVNMFAFMNPFSIDVWIYTVTLYLIVSIILFFVARMAPGDWENPHPCDQNPSELENIWDLKNCFWLTLGSIMTQGCDILSKGISSRMTTAMWWFFSLIMTSSYTANLAAFLTMERLEPTIDSAEALAKQSKIKYGTVDGGATQAFFRDSNYSTYQRMWTMMVQSKPDVFVKSNAEGVLRVQTTRQRGYAFFMESIQIEYEVETKCDLKQVGNWLDSKGYGIAMPIGDPLRGAIDGAILTLQENGKLAELKEKWWKKMRTEPSCEKGESSEESSSELALANVGGVFLVLGIGVAIAFLLAILEFLWNVKNVSVEEHITYWEALKLELLFALNVWITRKRTKQVSESSSSHSGGDSKSIAHSILHSAGSFLNLSMTNRGASVNGREK